MSWKNIEGKRIGDLKVTEDRVEFLSETIETTMRKKFKKYQEIEIYGWNTGFRSSRLEVNYLGSYVKEWVMIGGFDFGTDDFLKDFEGKPVFYWTTSSYTGRENQVVYPLFNHVKRELKKILKLKVDVGNIRKLGRPWKYKDLYK